MNMITAREDTLTAASGHNAPRIYNLFPLLFRDFEHMAEFLPHVSEMGFDWVFLNPVHEPGVSGSLYCIRDPFSVSARLAEKENPDLGEVLSRFCTKAEANGLKVMVDLVINHTAIDSVLVSEHADWIARDRKGKILNPGAIDPADATKSCVWGDLGSLDYGSSANRTAMTAYWLELIDLFVKAGVRGFRCDAAYQVPVEIWQTLIAKSRLARPGLIFAAETLGCRLEEVEHIAPAGFDFFFNSVKWWDLDAPWAIEQYNAFRHIAPSIAFPESHDTPRIGAEHPDIADPELLQRFALMRYALAAALSTGVMMPVGYECGFRKALNVVTTSPDDWETPRFDLTQPIARINAAKASSPALSEEGPLRRIFLQPGLTILHRASHDGRHHALFAVKSGRGGPLALERWKLAEIIGVEPDALKDPVGLDDAARFTLADFEWRLLTADSRPIAHRMREIAVSSTLSSEWNAEARVAIEAIYPEIEGGRFPIKRVSGDLVSVWADIFRDGHDIVGGRILYRPADEKDWRGATMRHFDNDRWTGGFIPNRVGRWFYTIEAWTDAFATWRRDIAKKHAAGLNIGVEIQEGQLLIKEARTHAPKAERTLLNKLLKMPAAISDEARLALMLSAETVAAMERWGPRHDVTRYPRVLELTVDRPAARFSSWYEIMPRSQGADPTRSATFADCARRIPDIAAMGFDVLYLLPIHPIGRINRKGPNNTLTAGPGDPGSPYAIGSALGGHTAIHPELGTIEAFRALTIAAREQGMEVALDFAIQCTPDHPWVAELLDWFKWRPDGTIKYAENPPKKYQDIVNIEFYGPAREAVWQALADILLYWAGEGVRIFRVDNPHTKPLPFWEWAIRTVQADYPDVIFLAEAFTRPKMMRRLAKAGFTMSYTYFTWRNTKAELTEYVTELAHSESREYFRPNFFANTPDILPPILQTGGPGAFRIRFALASLLSGVYGIYNGFELCEGTGIPGTEDYLHSEKYQFKVWDWDRPGNIKSFIAQLNRVRRENSALQDWINIAFHPADSEQILFFSKTARDLGHTIFAAITLDPHKPASGTLHFPGAPADMENLVNGGTQKIGSAFRVELTPDQPVLLLRHRPV